MLSPFVLSLIRTAVPAAVGMVASWLLLSFGVTVPEDLVVAATAAFTGVFLMLYYLAARAVERRWPAWSWLLGTNAQPIAYEQERPSGATTIYDLPSRRHTPHQRHNGNR